jgi:hypothetical protein
VKVGVALAGPPLSLDRVKVGVALAGPPLSLDRVKVGVALAQLIESTIAPYISDTTHMD